MLCAQLDSSDRWQAGEEQVRGWSCMTKRKRNRVPNKEGEKKSHKKKNQHKKQHISYWLAHPQGRHWGRINANKGNIEKELRLIQTICILTEAHLEPSPVKKPVLFMNGALISFMQEINQEVLDQETKEMKGWENLSLCKVLGYTENVLPFCRF